MHWCLLNWKGANNLFEIFEISRHKVHIQLHAPMCLLFSHTPRHDKGISASNLFEIMVRNMNKIIEA